MAGPYGKLKADKLVWWDTSLNGGSGGDNEDTLEDIANKAALTGATFTGTVTGPTINASTTLQIDGVAITSTAAELNILDGVTSTAAELNILDGVTSTAAELNYSDGVTSNIQTQLDAKQALEADLTALSSCQTGAATALALLTATEVGVLDGVTSTTAELNTLDGFTGDKDDLIYAKDLKATGVTDTEFDYLDGVTSAIQTQINAKAPLASPTLTGTPVSTTAAVSTNTTQIATTAFVVAEIADEVGTTVQAYDADLTSLSSCQSGGAAALAALTSTEIGIIDGATLSTAELNLLDGVTATTTELNYTDGVTSAIQTQLNAKGTGDGDALLASDQTWTGAQRGTITALTDASTIAVDFNSSNNYSVTLAGNRTLGQPSNQTAGQSGSIFVTQDGTGSRTLAYHADWKWAGGTAPTLSTTAAAVDRIDYIVAASNKVHAVASLAVA